MDKKPYTSAPIIVTGFPYAFPYYFKVFNFLPDQSRYVFILPKRWMAKNGKVDIKIEDKNSPPITFTARAWSYGGKTFLKGALKGWLPSLFFLLLRVKKRYGGRVLYSCSEPHLLTTFYNGLVAKLVGLRHILFTWQNVPPEQRMSGLKLKLSNFLVRLNLALADGVICGNKKAEQIIKHFRPDILTTVCPLSGVAVDSFGKVQPDLDSKTIIFYGALDRRKGLDILIEAFADLPPELDARLVIIGTGPARDGLENLARERGILNQVQFVDWMKNKDLPKMLATAAIFVYPSMPYGGWQEQFGYSMAEASAASLPIVSSKTGSIEEVVIDGKTGILVEPGRPDLLSKAILEILRDPELRQKLGHQGREFITATFGHKVIARKINDFLFSFL